MQQHTIIMSADISIEELDRIYAFAVQLGKDAGQMLLEAAEARYNGPAQTHIEKDSAVDIVTQTDEGQSFVSVERATGMYYLSRT